jgi:hypothetical protein
MGSNQAGKGSGSDDNVVRLPRDWLGPRDELVPFGPSAGTTTPGVDEDLPRSADDFWGEQSSAVHDAVQAPNGHAPLESEPAWFGVRAGAPESPPRRRRTQPGRLRASLARMRSNRRRLPARLSRLQVGLRGRHVNPKLAASLGVVAVLLSGLLIGNEARRSPTLTSSHRSAQLPATGSPPSGSSLTPATHLRLGTVGSAPHTRSSASARQHSGPRRRHTGVRASTRRSRASHPAPATVQPVHYTPAPSSSSDTGGSSSGASSSSTTVSSPSASAASAGSSGGQTPPAFGSNGTLGPGSSPDS